MNTCKDKQIAYEKEDKCTKESMNVKQNGEQMVKKWQNKT